MLITDQRRRWRPPGSAGTRALLRYGNLSPRRARYSVGAFDPPPATHVPMRYARHLPNAISLNTVMIEPHRSLGPRLAGHIAV